MNRPLSVSTDGVNSLADIHQKVAGAMSQLTGPAPDEASLQAAYGSIASAFSSALGVAFPSRDGTFQATSTSSDTIGKLLKAAAEAYERGDQANADTLRTAAEALAGSTGAGGASSQGGAAGPVGGADATGQLAGQVGQQVGQIAQGLAQSVQGLAQGLTQLPQQVMQGVQSLVESTTKNAGSDAATADEEDEDEDPEKRKREEAEAAERRGDEHPGRQPPSAIAPEGAQPGRAAEGGRAPEPPPAPERPKPAQTRPQ